MRLKNTKQIFNKAGAWCREHFSSVWKKVKAHGPEIKIATGVALMGSAVISSSFRGAKANERIKTKKEESKDKPLSKSELIKTIRPFYLGTAAMTSLGAFCIATGTTDILKKHAAIVGAYSMSISDLNALRNRVQKEMGEEKLQELTQKKNDIPKESGTSEDLNVVMYPKGMQLCKERVTGRFFFSSQSKIELRCKDLNVYLRDNDNLPYTEFYDMVGINEGANIRHYLGWNINNGSIRPIFNSGVTNEYDAGFEAGVPYLIVDFVTRPSYSEECDWYHID